MCFHIASLPLEPECEQNSQTILFSLRCILCNSVHFIGWWWFSTWKSSEAELALAGEFARLQTDKLTSARTNMCGRQGPFFQKALNFENHIFGGGQIGRVGGDICCPRGAMDG